MYRRPILGFLIRIPIEGLLPSVLRVSEYRRPVGNRQYNIFYVPKISTGSSTY